jgi:hypothetical protein
MKEKGKLITEVKDVVIHWDGCVVRVSYFENKEAPFVAGVHGYLDEYYSTNTLRRVQ